MNKQSQQGSVHVVVIVILILALLTALSWIFYQNFIQKEPVKTKTDLTIVEKKENQEVLYKGMYTADGNYQIKVPNGWSVNSGTYDTNHTLALFAGPNELKNLQYDASKEPVVRPVEGFGWDGLTEHFFILSQESETLDISQYTKSSFNLDDGIVGIKYTKVITRDENNSENFQKSADSYIANVYVFKKAGITVRAYLNYYSDTKFDKQLGEKVVKSIKFN